MSAETHPISPAQFAQAIQDLPIENIYAKSHEIQNSIAHLQRSNAQLQEYSDSIKNDSSLDEAIRSEGDRDCLDAISENEIVIKRQLERIELLKQEVERRGGRWHDGEAESEPVTNGTTGDSQNESQSESVQAPHPRLTDEELRRRLQEQMGDDSDEEGMHL